MARIILEPVDVHTNTESRVTAFIWRRRLYKVLGTLSWWREPSEWWNGRPVSFTLRVTAANDSPGIYELRKTGNRWFLYRLLD